MSKEQLFKHLMKRARQLSLKRNEKLLYKCFVCNRCCKTEEYLKIHMRCHERHKTGLYKCGICHFNFTNRNVLSSHLRHVHFKQKLNGLSKNATDMPHCVCCQLNFNSLLDLKKHLIPTFSQFPSLSRWTTNKKRHVINRNKDTTNTRLCKDTSPSCVSNSTVVASNLQSPNRDASRRTNNTSSVQNKHVQKYVVSTISDGVSKVSNGNIKSTSTQRRSKKKASKSNVQLASHGSRKLRAIRPKLPNVLIPVGRGISISGNFNGGEFKGCDPLRRQSATICMERELNNQYASTYDEGDSDSSLDDTEFMSLLDSAFQEDSSDKSEEDSEPLLSLQNDHEYGQLKTDYLNIIFGRQENELNLGLSHSKNVPNENQSETMEREMMRLFLHTYSFVDRASGVFKCVPCQNSFASETKLLDHLHVHFCHVCGTPFEHKDELVYHVHEHKFQACTTKYDSSFIQSMFEKFTNISDDGKMFTCKICPKHFAQRSSFFIHMYSHAQNLPENSEQTVQKRNSERKSSEERERSFRCPRCNKAFFSSKNLKGHMETHEETQKFLCSICGRGFRRKRALLNHLVVHSKKGDGQEVNIPQEIMNLRKRIKPKVRNPPSEIYEKELTSTSGSFVVAACFTPHKLLPDKKSVEPKPEETRERSFSCPVCNKKFFTNRNLRGHIETHNPQKKYSCSVCPRTFRRKQTMIRHVATHD